MSRALALPRWPRWQPRESIRARFKAWAQSRQPRTDSLLLTQRNVYILPTPAGWVFAGTLLVLLLASINYQLNLGYVLTFLLAGSGIVSMHVTHGTLRGLTLHLKPMTPVFAGDPAVMDIVMTSPGAARFGIGLKVWGTSAQTLSWNNVPALGQSTAKVSHVALTRGLHDAPTLSVETRFPLGLFQVWTVWRPAAQFLAYPAPERAPVPLPAALSLPGGANTSRGTQGGEAEGVRAYRRGDSMRMIAWKKTAKAMNTGGDLVSRDTSTASHQVLWLEYQACAGLAPEDRLSRLSAWTLAAHRAGVDYGLRLPGLEIEPGCGPAHRIQCLEALALWR